MFNISVTTKLRLHSAYLLGRHGVRLHRWSADKLERKYNFRSYGFSLIEDYKGMSIREKRKIFMPQGVWDTETYAIFMHEMGHIVSPNQSGLSQVRIAQLHMNYRDEVDAWAWAKDHAMLWTPDMDGFKDWALNTYASYKPKDWALCQMSTT